MHPFERVVAALQDKGCNVQLRGYDSARCTCPGHRDMRPSLVVTKKPDRVLLKCFAGCLTDDVVRALGLRFADLYLEGRREDARIAAVASYDYVDIYGEVIAQKVRLEPKSFRWRTPTASGRWRWGLAGRSPGLYRLPDVVDATQIIIVEGEKSCDRLSELGFASVCPPHGASSWRPDWSYDLWHAGAREVIVLPDGDRSGIQHAERVVATSYGVTLVNHHIDDDPVSAWRNWPCAVSGDPEVAPLAVKLVPLPGLSGGADIVDWLARGQTPADLKALIAQTPPWTPDGAERDKVNRRRAMTAARVRRFRERQRAFQGIACAA